MTDTSVARVRYYDQQILRTSDFVDEQAYHLAQRRRHNIGGHIWGIVYGLELAQDSNGGLSVQPGMAIDGYGRELILEQYQPIEARIFDDKGSETLDVYLEYAEQATNEEPPSYSACRAGQNTSNRVQEAVRLVIRKASAPQSIPDIDLPERRQPEGVPPDDVRFAPDRVPPNDPGRRWPVFLGQLQRGAEPPINLGGRPYAGLRGEMVLAPSAWAWLQVGEWPDNDYRFGVFLAERDAADGNMGPEASPRRFSEPVLGIKAAVAPPDGGAEPAAANAADKPASPTIELHANTTLSGDLLVEGGAIEFGSGPAYESAHPWRIYHVFKKNDQLESQDDISAQNELRKDIGAVAQDELRIEMAAPDGQGKVSEVVVGHWSEESKDFEPCLTVGAEGDVTVAGNLVVNGDLLRINKAKASNEALVRFVVRRTEITPKEPVPVWFGVLIDELNNKKLDKLFNLFLTTLVKKVQELGLLEVLVVELAKLDYRNTFLPALAQHTQADFVSGFLRALADLAKTDQELDKRLSAALADLTPTLCGSEFAHRFWPALAEQIKTVPVVRDALLRMTVEQVKADQVVRGALVDQLAVKDAAQAILQPLVRKIWEEQAGDSEQRAEFFANTLLGDLAGELRGDNDLRAALVAAIKAQEGGLAETLSGELAPAPAGADLQRFIDRLHDDAQYREDFKKKTKNEMVEALIAYARS